MQIDKSAAGVPRIDRRVGLDEILELLDTDVRSVQAADDTGSSLLADISGIAYGEHEIADPHVACLSMAFASIARHLGGLRFRRGGPGTAGLLAPSPQTGG